MTKPLTGDVILANLRVCPKSCKPLHPLRRGRRKQKRPQEKIATALPPTRPHWPYRECSDTPNGQALCGHSVLRSHAEINARWLLEQATLCPWAPQRCWLLSGWDLARTCASHSLSPRPAGFTKKAMAAPRDLLLSLTCTSSRNPSTPKWTREKTEPFT